MKHETVKYNEILDVINQRLGNNPTIFGEPVTITDAAQITECKNYGSACIVNLKEHRELGNLYMDCRYDPLKENGVDTQCPLPNFWTSKVLTQSLDNLCKNSVTLFAVTLL
jgi:hypothetical protein